MNARVFGALLLRDAVVAKREIVAILIRTMVQPVLFVIVFGLLLPRMGIIPRDYAAVMLPGIVALAVTMTPILSVAMPLISDFGTTKEIEDRLLAPVPIELIAIQKVVSGVLQGVLAVLFVMPVARLLMGPVEGLTLRNLPLLAVMVILGGAVFSAFGLLLGTSMPPQHVSLMMQVIFAPMIMLGCAYYPWRGLDHFPVLQYAVLINPLVYISEGMRAALTPEVEHMPVAAILGTLIVLTAVLLWAGLRQFRKRAIG
ncbi:MAG TPA: ABC transporter permease [Thermoanaerobaculia bacterium]